MDVLLPCKGGEAVDEDLDGVGEVHAVEVVLVDLVLAVGQLRPLHLRGVSLGAGVPRRHHRVLKMIFCTWPEIITCYGLRETG